MSLIVYGIPNCDTVKKARVWLDDKAVAYSFHDYKKQGLEPARLKAWVEKLGWETLLNRTGTTFKNLPDADKQNLDARKAMALMLAQPSMIRRPVFESGGVLIAGFRPQQVAALGEALAL